MMKSKNISTRKICVGQFAGAHGVRGLVKLRSFTEDPLALFTYKPLTTLDGGRVFDVVMKSAAGDVFIATVEGVASKEDADALRGDKIYIARDILPETRKGEYYEADLIGLEAFDVEGKSYGRVMAVHDHGAGTFVEIGITKKDSFMLPFKDNFIPEINFDAGKMTIFVPQGWI